jgi:nucleoside triphosphate pyrophosphatase
MLILASASPRRQELLRNAGIPFTAQPADIDETPLAGESPRDCAERLAREKALVIWEKRPQDLVLGADTVVVIDNQVLAKPADTDDAARMLRMLSGREHRVITGVCLAGPISTAGTMRENLGYELLRTGNRELSIGSEITSVTVTELSDDEIQYYARSGEPMDKAGGYAIQGIASRWIPRIEGDYANVVGLPVALVYRMLSDRGVQF